MMPLTLRHLFFLLLWLPFISWGQFHVYSFLIKPVLSIMPASRVERKETLNIEKKAIDDSMSIGGHLEPDVVLSRH
ncbi:MAG: hypothetical protein CVU06_04665 [Bacteroidetes bacterium HGW-Bacteroidetes-22]|nr:MAG: hypothetical protein CVU06_04665 [Bacteroidetes bacterium HGW-Bacteroidetes-22]